MRPADALSHDQRSLVGGAIGNRGGGARSRRVAQRGLKAGTEELADDCGHAAPGGCGEALSRPKLLRDTLLVLRHTVEALKLVFQF